MSISARPGHPSVILWCGPDDEASRTYFRRAELQAVQVSAEEGLILAQERPFDAIVAEWNDGWRKAVAKHARLGVFIHLGTSLPQGLLDFVMAGGNGWSASSSQDACDRIARTIAPERASPRILLGDDSWVSIGDSGLEARALDCSTNGLSFWVPANTPIKQFAHGLLLHDMTLRQAGETVLSNSKLRVRSMAPHEDGFRVGCQFEDSPQPAGGGLHKSITDPVQTLAAVARVSKSKPIQIITEQGVHLRFCQGRLETANRHLCFDQPASVVSHELVQCFSEIDDSRFEWQSSVVSSNPLTLRIPLRLEEYSLRNPERRKPPRKGLLRFAHPLSKTHYEVPVTDFTPTGIRTAVPNGSDPFPPGLRVQKLTLVLDDIEVQGTAEVRYLQDGHIGMKLTFVEPDETRQLRLAWVLAGAPELKESRKLGFDESWEFLIQRGLVKPEVTDTFPSLLAICRSTRSKLATDDGTVFNAMTVRADGALTGHISAFRAYQHTWFLQHLASSALGTGAPTSLGDAICDLCTQVSDAQYFRLAYYTKNPWPARVFNGIARRLERGGAHLKVRHYLRMRNDGPIAEVSSPHCRMATDEDIPSLLSFLSSQEPAILWHAMDLDMHRLWLNDLDALYSRVDLTRHRKVILCEDMGRCVAAALCEVSSVGFNYTELGGVARLYFSPELSSERALWTSHQMALATSHFYRSLGHPFTLFCTNEKMTSVPSEAAFGSAFQGAEFTIRAEFAREFRRETKLSSALAVGRPARHAKE